jgi:hypothetical protein
MTTSHEHFLVLPEVRGNSRRPLCMTAREANANGWRASRWVSRVTCPKCHEIVKEKGIMGVDER